MKFNRLVGKTKRKNKEPTKGQKIFAEGGRIAMLYGACASSSTHISKFLTLDRKYHLISEQERSVLLASTRILTRLVDRRSHHWGIIKDALNDELQ